MSEPYTPVAIEAAISHCASRIAKGVGVVNDRYKTFLTADRDYDFAYAQAFLDYDGPQTEKKHAAVIATIGEREARDVADAAYKYAAKQAAAATKAPIARLADKIAGVFVPVVSS